MPATGNRDTPRSFTDPVVAPARLPRTRVARNWRFRPLRATRRHRQSTRTRTWSSAVAHGCTPARANTTDLSRVGSYEAVTWVLLGCGGHRVGGFMPVRRARRGRAVAR